MSSPSALRQGRSALPDINWQSLSTHQLKPSLYAREAYFREGTWDASCVLGRDLIPVLHRLALVVLKPEALVGRRVEAMLEFLEANAFTPILGRPFSYTHHIVRELWRHQWNAATLKKIELSDRVNLALPTYLLVLRDDGESGALPGSVRLKALKGSADPSQREADSMRAALRSPNRILTIVHSADEPADVLRELGILFVRTERRGVITGIRDGFDGDLTTRVKSDLAQVEAAAPTSDFDPEAALGRILALADADTRDEIAAGAQALGRCAIDTWESFRDLCAAIGADDWDVISVCAHAVDHEDSGHEPLVTFGRTEIDAWRERAARVGSAP